MVPRNTSVVVQNMFSITPKPLNAIYVVLGSLIDKLLGVIDHQMLTKALQRLIASKGIRIVNRTLAGMVLDMGHERLSRDRLHYLGIDPAVPLQQAKNDAFASRTTASLPLPCAPKVRLIHLNLTRELSAFQFCRMEQNHPQSLIHPGNGLGIQAQITGQAVRWLLLIKALQDGNLAAQLREAFLLAAEHAFNIATRCLNGLKRTTKNTLATVQKVGRTTKNRMSPNNHKYLQGYNGYETP
jgi:hypothetical protein